MNELIEAAITVDVSPYRLADILTKLRGSLVRPQMVYAYVGKPSTSKLHIPSYRNSEDKKMIAVEDAQAFAVKYLTKNAPELATA